MGSIGIDSDDLASSYLSPLQDTTLCPAEPHKRHRGQDGGAWTQDQLASPVVAVLGVGYVGHTLAASCSRAGLRVVGYDVSASRIQELSRQGQFSGARVHLTTRAEDLAPATHFLVCVSTSVSEKDGSVDTSCVREALALVRRHARPGSTVVIESSVAVGTTRALLGPVMARHGLFGGMSPERVDPGRTDPPPTSIPKLVAGLDDITPGSTAAITRLYRAAGFTAVVPVPSPEVAEMAKLYENCQRVVGIAFANEMADACAGLGIDAAAVLAAAATKPFGYMPYAPGVGVGGACLPTNATYLMSSVAGDDRQNKGGPQQQPRLGLPLPLLASAAASTAARPRAVADRVLRALRLDLAARKRAHVEKEDMTGGGVLPSVLVVGVAYKKGQGSTIASPGLEVATALAASGRVDLWWADSLVPQSRVPSLQRLPEGSWSSAVLGTFAHIVVSFLQPDMDPEVLTRVPAGVVVHRW